MMLPAVLNLLKGFSHLLFPHVCAACGTSMLPETSGICSTCLLQLPVTGFLQSAANPVEQVFWGRIPLSHATACCFFTKKTRVQKLLHQIKYQHRKDAGQQLGEWMGYQLKKAPWLAEVEVLVPMPLHHERLAERGYNQAALLCEGISAVTGIVMVTDIINRKLATRSQTGKHRHERWKNLQGVFEISRPEALANRHLLLIDDVITTGATMEALGEELIRTVPGIRISICCFAYTIRH